MCLSVLCSILFIPTPSAKRVTSMRISEEADRIVGESSVKNFCYNLRSTIFFLILFMLCYSVVLCCVYVLLSCHVSNVFFLLCCYVICFVLLCFIVVYVYQFCAQYCLCYAMLCSVAFLMFCFVVPCL